MGVKKFLGGVKKWVMSKKRSSKKFCLYIQNGGHDIQKWVNLSTFWKILALGFYVHNNFLPP